MNQQHLSTQDVTLTAKLHPEQGSVRKCRNALKLGYIYLSVLLLLGFGIPLLPNSVSAQEVYTVWFEDSGQRLGTSKSTDIALGDLDNDGDLDAFVTNSDNQPNQIWLNQGGKQKGTLAAFRDSEQSLGSDSQAIALGDLDGDGDLDAVVVNSEQPDAVWINQGGAQKGQSGSFVDTNPLGYSGGNAVALGDLDEDGDLDAIVDNRIWLNQNGKQGGVPGEFKESSHSLGDSNSNAIALGDIDGDGDLDAFIANSDGEPNGIWLNQGGKQNGIFGEFLDSGQSLGFLDSNAVSLGDIDNDGDLDAFVGNWSEPDMIWVNQGGKQNGILGFFEGTVQDFEFLATTDIKLMDLDSDGDLDAFIAHGFQQPNGIWINQGGKQGGTVGNFVSNNEGLGELDSTAVALGDLDNDGDLDAFVANSFNQSNKVWMNRASDGLIKSEQELGDENSSSVALGDLDGDDDLDAFVTYSSNLPNRIWINQGGVQGGLIGTFVDSLQELGTFDSFNVALGDLDGDNDLDAFVANRSQPNKIWINQGGVQGGTLGKFKDGNQALGDSESFDIALGDLDGDNDLDAFVANWGQPNKIWINQGGDQGGTPGTFSDSNYLLGESASFSVSLGDLDNDGDLDAFVTNSAFIFSFEPTSQPNEVWINQGGIQEWGEGIFLSNGQNLGSLDSYDAALGDLDGDGDLDAFVANSFNQPNTVWINQGGLQSGVAGEFVDSGLYLGDSNSSSVKLTDFDNDGDLDAFVTNEGGANKLWLNQGNMHDGTAISFSDSGLELGNSNSLAVSMGDVDGDGDVDAFVVNNDSPDRVYLSEKSQFTRFYFNNLQRPGSSHNADSYSSTELVDDNLVAIPFTLSAPRDNFIGGVVGSYSLNGGGNWRPAVAENEDELVNLETMPEGTEHIFLWNIFDSDIFGQSDNVVFRLVAYAQPLPTSSTSQFSYTNSIPNLYLHPSTTATTFPFRLRGTQVQTVRVDENGETVGVGNTVVYRLPDGQFTGAKPLGSPFLTDNLGYLQGGGQLDIHDSLIALSLQDQTDKYDIYHMSQVYDRENLTNFSPSTVITPGVQTLTISSENPLILFNLDISLEWDARNDLQYLDDLQDNLQRTSELLYDLSNSQAALGKITIYHNKTNWLDADVRIYATNRLRPFAKIGGIEDSLRAHEVTKTDGMTQTLLFSPGQVHMGATWNRYGDVGTELSDDWPRTLAHELGHYLFYLLDNYAGIERTADGKERFFFVEGCRGMMNFPYDDLNSEFHPDNQEWDQRCGSTLSAFYMGRSDWETILAFYPRLFSRATGVDDTAQQGPSFLSLAVTQITTSTAGLNDDGSTLAVSTFTLNEGDGGVGQTYTASGSARAFLFKENNMIDLGSPRRDRLQARSAAPGDILCVYDFGQRDAAGNRRTLTGCDTVTTLSANLSLNEQPEWQPEVTVIPVGTNSVRVEVTGTVPSDANLYATIYPAHEISNTVKTKREPMIFDEGRQVYSATITTTRLYLEAYVHVFTQADNDVNRFTRGAMLDYKLGSAPAIRLVDAAMSVTGTVNSGTQQFEVKPGGTLEMADGSTLFLSRDGLTLEMADGSTLEMADGSTLEMADGSTLEMADGSTLEMADGSTLEMADGSTLEMADGSTLEMADGSTLEMADGSVFALGVGPTLEMADGSTLEMADGSTLSMADGSAPIRSSDGQVTIFIDNLRLGWGEFYTIQPTAALPDAPLWATTIGNAYRITKSDALTETLNGSIFFQYLGSEVADDKEHLLYIYYYDGTTWTKLENTSRDPQRNFAVADAPDDGIYALMYSLDAPLRGSGWNPVSYPVQGSRPVTVALGASSINDDYQIVYGYDASQPDFEHWKLHAKPSVPTWVNTLARLEFGHTYLISITGSVSTTVQFADVFDNQITAASIASNGLTPPATYYGHIPDNLGFEPEVGMTVTAKIDDVLCGQTTTREVDGNIVYAITVYAQGDGELAECGKAGKFIDLSVGERLLWSQLTWQDNFVQELDPNMDSDGDTIPDAVEGEGDVDGDGIPNNLDPTTPTALYEIAEPHSPSMKRSIFLPFVGH